MCTSLTLCLSISLKGSQCVVTQHVGLKTCPSDSWSDVKIGTRRDREGVRTGCNKCPTFSLRYLVVRLCLTPFLVYPGPLRRESLSSFPGLKSHPHQSGRDFRYKFDCRLPAHHRSVRLTSLYHKIRLTFPGLHLFLY